MTLRELCSLNTSWIARSLCKLVQCSHRSCQRDARRPSPRPSLPPHQCLYLITTPARRLCAGNQLGDNVEHLVTWGAPARSLMNKQAQRGVLKQRKPERKISQIYHLSRSTLASPASPGRSAKYFASTSRPCHSRCRRVGVIPSPHVRIRRSIPSDQASTSKLSVASCRTRTCSSLPCTCASAECCRAIAC